ncbi:hypothetical protein EK599_02560 [Vibrio sp. T187]|uniref:hypothetical protein n=1 Tax=Vibrio TaxID=662 RepID=UPI0010C9C566|nr:MULTISPECIES: hypothetical protein [Vibrio]MBW3694557.1 hypothetical protein [Vibrio sp. T187]
MFARISAGIQLTLAVAIFYLGYSIHTFTSKVGEVVDTYPQVIADFATLTDDLKVEEWLVFAATIEELAPQMLNSVEEVRKTVEQVNQTVASVDQKIPRFLDEVEGIRTVTLPELLDEVEKVRTGVIPPTLAEMKRYRLDVIPPTLVESKAYRTQVIPAALQESAHLREDVPVILAKADQVVEKSKVLAQQATQGAVEGTVKGVVLSPINLLRDAGNELKSKVQE